MYSFTCIVNLPMLDGLARGRNVFFLTDGKMPIICIGIVHPFVGGIWTGAYRRATGLAPDHWRIPWWRKRMVITYHSKGSRNGGFQRRPPTRFMREKAGIEY